MKIDSISDRLFFTADHHFGHENIIKYTNRQFKDVAEMDEAMIQSWNETVPRDGIVYYLGDFTLRDWSFAKPIFDRLSGRTIYVLTNPWHHDRLWLPGVRIMAELPRLRLRPPIVVLESDELGDGTYPMAITLCHYPMGQWDRKHHGAWHMHGHSHDQYALDVTPGIIDVGVDAAYRMTGEYRPLSWSECVEALEV
jgi:calcineurin-like phosphoesterase family protein